jgi:hypothetical protein
VPLIERYIRMAELSWVLSVFEGLSATFGLTSVDVRVRIPLADVYASVDFPEHPKRYPLTGPRK